MKLLDELKIHRNGESERSLELWHGDLTALPKSEAVDILVVSAFPDSYSSSPNTLMKALADKGVFVSELAQDKMVDLRKNCSCWLSKPLKNKLPGVNFNQILCFEPSNWGKPGEVVGDIFRSVVPFVCSNYSSSIAMPLVSTGNVRADKVDMMEALFKAAVGWLEHGLPIKRLKIVEISELKAMEMKGIFGLLKKQYHAAQKVANPPKYDVFISYSHQNDSQMHFVVQELKRLAPNLRIFLDRIDLEAGVFWQEKIHRSLDDSRKVFVLYSPDYFSSINCQEEFNHARILHLNSKGKFLFPVYLYSADAIPPHASDIQYLDCREADDQKLANACRQLVLDLG